MNEYQETYEKEISLMDLMFYCLKKWAYSRKLFAICHFQPICVYKLPPRYYSQGLVKFLSRINKMCIINSIQCVL